ncbi:integrase core domain-containing protein [Bradyrhizobium sp. PMVTL-01]|uniref:integrase core domain-containing protein n=1 Tax=Bradyrhizobium sp. PMVTL-01 TaxID=3434999 RepID=UPI003F6EF90B
MVNGADVDEEDETEDRRGAEGQRAARGPRRWIAFYNEERPHQAHGYRTPMAVWRAGVTAKAVDMVDNAEEALPTCPQPQQQTRQRASRPDVRKSERRDFQLRRRRQWSCSRELQDAKRI